MKILSRFNGRTPTKDMVMNKRNQSNHNMDVLSASSHFHGKRHHQQQEALGFGY
jgi:hypothetical protein